MKYLFFFVAVLFVSAPAVAQNYGLSQVRSINSQTLKRVDIESDSGKFSLVGENRNFTNGKRSIYVDDYGGIRKFICYFNRTDGDYCIIAYYNRWGALASLIFRSWTPGGYIVEGNAQTTFFGGRKEIADTVAYTYCLKYDDGKQWTDTQESGRSYSYPEQFGDLELAPFSSITKLLEQYALGWTGSIPSNSKSVHFASPNVGNVTFVIQNDIAVRRVPTTNSTKVATLNAGQRVWITGVSRKETIAKLGTHYWYRISLTEGDTYPRDMFVYGAFLEPVERRIYTREY